LGSRLFWFLASAFSIVASHGCAPSLADGEVGRLRIMGFVRGAPPEVQVFAPATDRAGNTYLLAGRRDQRDFNVFVARAGGGVASGCRATKGDRFGPVGWIGFARDTLEQTTTGTDIRRGHRQWYWAGNALVRLSDSGDCRRVLDRDPTSGIDLLFEAVIPWVNDTPAKTTGVALVRSVTDPVPFTVLLDLNAGIYTTPRPFEPANASNVVVHGTGAQPQLREGVVLLSFDEGGSTRVEGRFYDEEGNLTGRVGVGGAENIGPMGIRGFLQESEAGLVAGLTNDRRVVLFDRSGGRTIPVRGMDPVGLHAWNGVMYLVGTGGGRPLIAPVLDNGDLGAPVLWESSVRIQQELVRDLPVDDDRAEPRRTTSFEDPRPTGAFPLVTEHSPAAYAIDQTLVTVAGPVVGDGEASFTLVAAGPVGVRYP